jgi:stalled ribosome alternative rescue factor ArfA
MKQTITIIDRTKKKTKEITKSFNVPNKNLLQAQLAFHSQTFTPKKGKGSFKRNKRASLEEF